MVAAGADIVSHAGQLIWAAAPAPAAVGDRAVRAGLLRTVAPDAPAVTALIDSMRARGTLLEPTLLVMQLGAARSAQAPLPLDPLPAWALGISDSTGTIAVGKWADLLVLRADPAADIRNTQTIRYVIRRGYVHERTGAWETPPLAQPPE